jgi:tetratricopeptide (TPR) repeat protein
MNRPAAVIIRAIALSSMLVFCQGAWSAAISIEASSLNVVQMGSLTEIKSALNVLESGFAGVKSQNLLSFDLQKIIAIKSGDCISRLVELSQKADMTQAAQKEAFAAAFLKNGELLRGMASYNQARIDTVLEERPGSAEDKSALFASTEWRQSQYLISLASYWLGWNGYYGGLLYPEYSPPRTNQLEEAITGFSRAMMDFQEQSVVNRSLFGRALCHKELGRHEKAQQELQSLMAKVSREDGLYAQAGYERALISYQEGKKELASKQLQEVQEGARSGAAAQAVREKIKNLQTTIALGIVEKKTGAQAGGGKESGRDTVRELKKIAEADPGQAAILYRYVFEHAPELAGMPDTELGGMGAMALADWYFDKKQYDKAIERYRRLYSSHDAAVKSHFDDVCFRLAYCLSQREQWQEALSCLENMFEKFPKSSFNGKAACLYYAVAARLYKTSPAEATYGRYIKAAECYVKYCPDPQDKSEAHFQLGQYYQHKNKTAEALQEFSLVKNDSSHFAEAQQAGRASETDRLQANSEKLEELERQGRGQSDEALQLYRVTVKQAEQWYKQIGTKTGTAGSLDSDSHLVFHLARLYVRGPEPDCKKALALLENFESRFPVNRQRDLLYGMVKKLRLECYLQLHKLAEAEREIGAIAGTTSLDRETVSFVLDQAEAYYKKAKDAGQGAQAAENAQTAVAIYKKLGVSIATHDTFKELAASIDQRLAELYTMTGQPEQAAALYRKRLEQDPTSGDAIYKLGLIYEQQNKWQDVFETWQRFSKGLAPGSSQWFEARYREAQALSRLGKQADACQVIAATRTKYSDFGVGDYRKKFMDLAGSICGRETEAAPVQH